MKIILLSVLLGIFITYNIEAQTEKTPENKIKKNTISANFLGTATYLGITYERLITQRLSLEVGLGLVGIGAGITIYTPKNLGNQKFNPYLGLKTTYNTKLSGGEKLITYIPVGVTYFPNNFLAFSIDIGPAYWIYYSPHGKVGPEASDRYPYSEVNIFGNVKAGFRF